MQNKHDQSAQGRVLTSLTERCNYFEGLCDRLQETIDDACEKKDEINKRQLLSPALIELKQRKPRQPYPLNYMAMCLKQMGNGTPASRIPANVLSVLQFACPKLGISIEDMPSKY